MAAPAPSLSAESVSLPSIHQMFPDVMRQNRGGESSAARHSRVSPTSSPVEQELKLAASHTHFQTQPSHPAQSNQLSHYSSLSQLDPRIASASISKAFPTRPAAPSALQLDIPHIKLSSSSYPPSGGSEYSSYPLTSQSTSYASYPSPTSPVHAGPSDNDLTRRHVCTQCNKRFNRPSSLRIHVNTHTGATPFRCPWPNCNREFNVNSNMRRHYRNHTVSAASTPPITDSVLLGPAPSASTSGPPPSPSKSATPTPSSSRKGKAQENSLKLQPQSFHPYAAAYDQGRISPFAPSSASSSSSSSVSPQLREEKNRVRTAMMSPGIHSAPVDGPTGFSLPQPALNHHPHHSSYATVPHSAPAALSGGVGFHGRIALGMGVSGVEGINVSDTGGVVPLDSSSGMRSTIS